MSANSQQPPNAGGPPPVPPEEEAVPVIVDDAESPPEPPAGIPDAPALAAPPPTPAGSAFMDRVKPIAKPLLDKAWLYVQVWIPFLANPQLRARQIKYRARENRDGLEWSVRLPQQCWQCGTKTGLKNRTYDKDVRTFEFAASIIGVTIGSFFLSLLIGVSIWSAFLLIAPLSLVVGASMLFIKSWIERVELTMSTCEAHSEDMRCPELVIDDETLFVHAPNAALADVAIEALRAERSKGPRYVPPETSSKGPRPMESVPMDSGPEPAPAAAKPGGYSRQELPPIKLDAPPELVDPMMQADPAEGGHKIQFDEPIKFGESIKLDDKIQLDEDQPPKS